MRKSLIVAAIIVSFVLGTKAQQHVEEPRPQILLVYNHSEAGKFIVLAKAQPILALRQADPEKHLAPIEKGTLMLCRPYNEGAHLMFRCGQDVFVTEAINLEPEK